MTSPEGPLDARDGAVLSATRELFARIDPVPSGLTDRIRFAVTVQALQAEVAKLISTEALAVRGGDENPPLPTESVTFTAGAMSIMVTATPAPDGATTRLDGWVTSGGAEIEACVGEDRHIVVADGHGRFVIEGLPRGRTHFVVRTRPGDPAARPIVTPEVAF